jgi:hypothetical protein
MTARLPSLHEVERRVSVVERESSDLRGLVIDVRSKVEDNRLATRDATESLDAFYGEWKASGLRDFGDEWEKFREESKAETEAAKAAAARESAINHEQDARLARYEAAAAKVAQGAERAENAAPAFEGAMDKLDKLAIPPRNASLRQWGTFAIAAAIALWEILKTAGVIK